MNSNKICTRHSTNKTFKTKSSESTCPPKNGALARRGAGGSGRSPLNNCNKVIDFLAWGGFAPLTPLQVGCCRSLHKAGCNAQSRLAAVVASRIGFLAGYSIGRLLTVTHMLLLDSKHAPVCTNNSGPLGVGVVGTGWSMLGI